MITLRKNIAFRRDLDARVKQAYRDAGNKSESEFIRDAVRERLHRLERQAGQAPDLEGRALAV